MAERPGLRSALDRANLAWGTKGIEPPGGPPHDGGMEARVATLEEVARDTRDTLKRMDGRLGKIETDLAELKGRVSQLPSTIQLIGFALAVLAITGALRIFGTH